MTQVSPSRPLVLDGVTKTYPGGVQAVRGISFDVADGEIFGLLGPNGAGKTTTLGVLTTLVRPSGGRAMVAGLDVARDPLAVRRAMGVVFQDSVLDNDFSGLANMRLYARLWRVPEDRIARLLAAVGLTDRASDSVRTYSGGMKRRLEIARALLGRPQILLLDEPTLGLDPIVRSELWEMIRALQAEHAVTVLVSTHYLEEAQSVCDRVAIIDQGKIIALDAPSRLIDDLGEHVLDVGVAGDPVAVVAVLGQAAPSVGEPMRTGSTVSVPSSLAAPELANLANRLDLYSAGAATISIRPATLNDVFLHLTSAARARMEVVA